MKKWFYVLFPIALLAIFMVFYAASRKEAAQKEEEHRMAVMKAKQEEDAKKAAANATARADAEKRAKDTAEREAKEAKEKEDKYNSDMARIKEDTAKSNATAEVYAKKVSELTIKLDSLRKERDALTRQTFEMDKQIQLNEVARHNAEMEIQRYDQMIAEKAEASQMAKMPPPPVEAKS